MSKIMIDKIILEMSYGPVAQDNKVSWSRCALSWPWLDPTRWLLGEDYNLLGDTHEAIEGADEQRLRILTDDWQELLRLRWEIDWLCVRSDNGSGADYMVFQAAIKRHREQIFNCFQAMLLHSAL